MNLLRIKSWAAYGVGFAAVYLVAKLFRVPVEMHEGHVDIKSKGKGKSKGEPEKEATQAESGKDGTKND